MVNITYFHKAVKLYISEYKPPFPERILEELADQVFSEVKHTINPTPDEIEKMCQLRIKRRLGFSHDGRTSGKLKWPLKDVAILQSNWLKFCQKYKVDNPFWFQKSKKGIINYISSKNLRRFKEYLTQGLPNRSVESIYKKWFYVFCIPKTGLLSEAELSLARRLMHRCKEKNVCDVLMLALQRNRNFIKQKFKNPDNRDRTEKITIEWSMDLEAQLVTYLAKELEAKELKDLEKQTFDWQWIAIAKQMGLTKQQVYNHWHYHLQPALMMKEWVTRGGLQVKLIKRLRKLLKKGEIDDWRKVDWTALGQYAGGFCSLYVYRLVLTMRWNGVKSKEERDSIHESIRLLWENVVPRILEREVSGKKTYLRRLVCDWDSKCLTEIQPAS